MAAFDKVEQSVLATWEIRLEPYGYSESEVFVALKQTQNAERGLPFAADDTSFGHVHTGLRGR